MPLLANLEREKPKLTRDHEQIKGHMDKQNINKIKNKERKCKRNKRIKYMK